MRPALLDGDTLGACLTRLVAHSPGSAATFPGSGERLPPADLDASATAAARRLRAAGVVPGEVVGLLVPTTIRLFTTMFGLWRAGAAVSVLPVQAGFGDAGSTARRLARIAHTAGMRHLVLDPEYAAIGTELRALMPELVVLEPYREGAEDPGDDGRPLPVLDPEDLAVVQFTSGSTNSPKGVMLPHRAVVAGLRACVVSGAFSPDDVFVQWVPVFHDMGLIGLLSHWLNGSDVHIFTPTAFLRQPAKFLAYLAAVGGSVVTGPNFSYDYLLDAMRPGQLAELDLSRWRLAFNGSEPVQLATVERFTTTLAPCGLDPSVMYPVYGMAEATLSVSYPVPGTLPRSLSIDRDALAATGQVHEVAADHPAVKHVVSVGRAVHGITLRIVAPDGTPAADGRLGEIQISGPPVTTGYYRDPAATARLFDGGWLRTGDLGFLLGDDLFVAGRLKEMVVVRGQNFFPDDVEAVAREVPGVYRGRCVAFSDVDADGAEHIGVIVEAKPGAAEELRREVARRVSAELDLGAVRVYVVKPRWLPRTTSGKWQRGLASQLLADELKGASR